MQLCCSASPAVMCLSVLLCFDILIFCVHCLAFCICFLVYIDIAHLKNILAVDTKIQ